MAKLVYYGKVNEKGVFKIDRSAHMRDYIKSLQIGDQVEISIHPVEDERTAKQNRLYWLYLRKIAKTYGEHTAGAFHDYFKERFLSYTIVVAKEEVHIVKSTAELTLKEFSEYLEQIIKWASQNLSLVLCTPEEAAFLRTIKKEG